MRSVNPRQSRRSAGLDRVGAAVVEAAICLPVLVLILFGTIETCNMLFVSQSLKIVAFEGSRVGTVPGAEADNVQYQCETLLDDRDISGATIAFTPDPATLQPGEFFQVTIEAPCGPNSVIGSAFFAGRTIVRSASLPAKQ